MKRTLIALVAFSISLQAFALDLAEKHRLGAYLTFVVVTSKDIGGGGTAPDKNPSGGVCQDCSGLGWLGDGTIRLTCSSCGGTGRASSATSPQSEPEEIPEEIPQEQGVIPEPEPEITQLRQTNWNWTGKNNPPDDVMRKHLMVEHDVDPSSANKMSRQEMISLHNLLHNSEVRAAAPKSKSSSSCPSGNCPTSSSSSSTRRYSLFRRR